MIVVHGFTIWLLFSGYLLFHTLRLPGFMPRAAMTLLCAELVALLVVSYAPRTSVGHDAASALAGQDVPALGILLYGIAIAFGIRAHRRGAQVPEAPSAVTTRSR